MLSGQKRIVGATKLVLVVVLLLLYPVVCTGEHAFRGKYDPTPTSSERRKGFPEMEPWVLH